MGYLQILGVVGVTDSLLAVTSSAVISSRSTLIVYLI